MRTQSFLQRQPYWTTLEIAVGAGKTVAALVLKDGTIAVGLRVAEMCLEASSHEEYNRRAAALEVGLRALPEGAYIQAVFETGGAYDGVLKEFAGQGRADSHPLLKHGRRLRADMFRALHDDQAIARCSVTYWLGWRGAFAEVGIAPSTGGALKAAVGRLFGLGLAVDAKRVRQAGRLVYEVAQQFVETVKGAGLRLSFLGESDVVAACHRALNPRHHRELSPRPVEGKPTLEPLVCSQSLLGVGDPPLLLRAVGVTELPDGTMPLSLHPAMFYDMPHRPFRLVVTHVATDRIAMGKRLKRKRRRGLAHMGRRGNNYDAAEAYKDADSALAAQAQGSSCFETHLVALVSGETEEELDCATTAVCRGLRDANIAAATLVHAQLRGWEGSLPAFGYRAPRIGTLQGRNCAHLLPYWAPLLGEQTPEILLNNRMRGLGALTVRPGKHRAHAGAIVVGSLGSGKTLLLTHLLKYGCLDLGGHAVIADNKGPKNSTFKPLCELYGGRYISLDQNQSVSFNPVPTRREVFDNPHMAPHEALDPLVKIVCMMAAPQAHADDEGMYWQTIARDVINLTYARNQDNAEPLTLAHVLDAFAAYVPDMDKKRQMAPIMRERLQVWLDAPRRQNLFNRPQHADLSNKFTVYDFFGMDTDPEASAVLVSVLCDRILQLLSVTDRELPKMFGFDEAWQMFSNPAACSLLNRLYRVTRSYGGFCVVASQAYEDILHCPAGPGIVLNTSMTWLLKHLDRHRETAEALSLTDAEVGLFKSLKVAPGEYSECLLIDRGAEKGGSGRRSHVLQYMPTPFDLWCDTSKPSDVALRSRLLEESGLPIEQVIERLAAEHPRGTA